MNTPPLRVLHVVGSMGYGGVETWLMHALRNLDRQQIAIDVVTTKAELGEYAPEAESLGCRVFPCPLRQPIWNYGRRLEAVLRGGNYDIVHSHVFLFSGYILRVAARAGVPVRIAHSHTSDHGKPHAIPRRAYRALMAHWIRKYCTHGLAASEAAAKALFGRDWRSDPRFGVFFCGIYLEPFRHPVSRDEVRQELHIPLDAPVVGHVGSFRRAKNHAFLLRVAAEVAKVRPDVRFLLIGEGPLRAEMVALARRLGIEKAVTFAGARPDVPRLMLGAMDLFFMPSAWEGLGLAVVEAQAAGLRCLVSDVMPAEAELVEGAVDSVPLSVNVEVWAGHLLRALECGRIAQPSALRAVEHTAFDIQTSVSRLAALYHEAKWPCEA